MDLLPPTAPMDYFKDPHGATFPCHIIGHYYTKARTFSFLTQCKPDISALFIILTFKALHLSADISSSNVCNLWKLTQGFLPSRPPMNYLRCWMLLKGWDFYFGAAMYNAVTWENGSSNNPCVAWGPETLRLSSVHCRQMCTQLIHGWSGGQRPLE